MTLPYRIHLTELERYKIAYPQYAGIIDYICKQESSVYDTQKCIDIVTMIDNILPKSCIMYPDMVYIHRGTDNARYLEITCYPITEINI
jgi:hypothetical protein